MYNEIKQVFNVNNTIILYLPSAVIYYHAHNVKMRGVNQQSLSLSLYTLPPIVTITFLLWTLTNRSISKSS